MARPSPGPAQSHSRGQPAGLTLSTAARPAPRVPAIVLTGDKVFDYSEAIAAGKLSQEYADFGKLSFNLHVNAQRKLAKVLHAKLVLDTHSGHEQPELTIKSIRQVVNQARADLERGESDYLDSILAVPFACPNWRTFTVTQRHSCATH
jgi:hypothetical protein